jgi:hypothetical protein
MLSNASFKDAAGRLIPVLQGLKLFSTALRAADVDLRLRAARGGFLLGLVDSRRQTDPSAASPHIPRPNGKSVSLRFATSRRACATEIYAPAPTIPVLGSTPMSIPSTFTPHPGLDLTIRSGRGYPGEAIARFNGWLLLVRKHDVGRRLAQFQNTSQLSNARSPAAAPNDDDRLVRAAPRPRVRDCDPDGRAFQSDRVGARRRKRQSAAWISWR